MRTRVLILGDNGMLGHVVKRYLDEQGYDVIGLNRNDIDMGNFTELNGRILNLSPDYVINCVGILNNGKDLAEFGRINVALPHILAHLCNRYGSNFRLIHISTNCVFDDLGPHDEQSVPNSKTWYGMSKALGEVTGENVMTIRTSIIGQELKKDGCGLFDWLVNKSDNIVTGFDNVYWNGVTTLELAKNIHRIIKEHPQFNRVLNLHTEPSIDKCSLLHVCNDIYNLNKTINQVQSDTAHSALLSKGCIINKSYEQQLEELKEWY